MADPGLDTLLKINVLKEIREGEVGGRRRDAVCCCFPGDYGWVYSRSVCAGGMLYGVVVAARRPSSFMRRGEFHVLVPSAVAPSDVRFVTDNTRFLIAGCKW